MADKKYIVAPGASFIGSGKTYSEGDEISASVFGEGEKGKKRFETFLSGDKPKIIPAPAGAANPASANENLDDVDISSIQNKPDREALKKIILEKGLLKEDKIEKMSDENLLKFAVKKGLIEK